MPSELCFGKGKNRSDPINRFYDIFPSFFDTFSKKHGKPMFILIYPVLGLDFCKKALFFVKGLVFRRGVSQAKLLRSVQFGFTTEISGLGTDRGFCSIFGNKFHARLDPEWENVELLPSEYAYNGEKYQLLDRINGGSGEFFSCSSAPILPSPSGTLDPLLLPYHWLCLSDQFLQWSLVKDDDAWNKVFSEAEYLGTETVEGHSCEAVRFPGTLPNTACSRLSICWPWVRREI